VETAPARLWLGISDYIFVGLSWNFIKESETVVQQGLFSWQLAHLQSCLVQGVNVILPVPWLRRLVAGLAQRRSGVDHKPVHVEFVIVRVSSGQVYIRLLLFPVLLARRQLQPHTYPEGQTDGTRCLSNARLSVKCRGARTENCFHTGFRGLSLYSKCE
jgi:hypothetical protein